MTRRITLGAVLAAAALLAVSCGPKVPPAPRPSAVKPGKTQKGLASWYGPKFHGRRTASGERYNMLDLTAAHRTLPFGTYVRVRNMVNDRRLVVRINDRGPFIRGRIIDLSYSAAKIVNMTREGVVKVELEILDTDTGERIYTRQSDLAKRNGIRTWSDADFAKLEAFDQKSDR